MVLFLQHANLLPQDMTAVRNMKLIGEGQEGSYGIFPMKFGIAKVNVFNRYFFEPVQFFDQYLTSSFSIIRENGIGKSVQEKMNGVIRGFLR